MLVPFNTANFVDPDGNPNALVRANSGNWAILWDAETVSTNGQPSITATGSGIAGAHHTVYLNMFLKSFAGQPLATTKLIGNTATNGTLNGTSPVELEHGFEVNGVEITSNVGGYVTGETLSGFQAGFAFKTGANATVYRPAEDIVSYGAASDTFVHCASFTALQSDVSGLLGAANVIGPFSGNTVLGPSSISTGAAFTTPGPATYVVGDDTSFIQLFWVQLIASGDAGGGSNSFAPSTGSSDTIQMGANYQLLTANLNLTTMTISGTTPNNNPTVATGQAQVPYTATMNSGDPRAASAAQAEARFVTYNNLVFWNFVDASLADSASATVAQAPGVDQANIQQRSEVLSVVAVIPQAGGSAQLGAAANQTDVTVLGSAGRHQTATSTSSKDTGEEVVTLGVCASNIGTGCSILGPDEGQGDVTAFVIGQVSTNLPAGQTATSSTTTPGNTDAELWAVALQAVGANAGTLDGANNPRIVSVHQAEVSTASANATQFAGTSGSDVTTPLADPVADVKLQLSRDGTYALLGWRQALGTSQASTLGLQAAVYQVAVVTSLSQTAPTLSTLDERLSAPVLVNAGSAGATGIAYTNQANVTDVGTAVGAPVVAWDFQDHVSYATGFQGVANQMIALYLYNDGTQDRLWVNTLVVTLGAATSATTSAPPTLKTLNELEIDATPSVPGVAVYNTNGSLVASTFTFVSGSHGFNAATYSLSGWTGLQCTTLTPGSPAIFKGLGFPTISDAVDSVDAGSVAATPTGDVLIVFSKVVDATTSDNTFFNREILATLYSPTSTAPLTDVVLSTSPAENATSSTTVNTGFGPQLVPNYFAFSRQLVQLVPNAKNPSVTAGKGYSPSNGTYVYFTDLGSQIPQDYKGLFTRHFLARTPLSTGSTVPTLAADFVPASGATASATTYAEPLQIDTLATGEDVSDVSVLTAGTEALVAFLQDDHWWATITQNGNTYTSTGGLSTPILIDNNYSVSAASQHVSPIVATPAAPALFLSDIFPLEGLSQDQNGDDLHGTILFMVKDDVDQNQRIFVRVLQ